MSAPDYEKVQQIRDLKARGLNQSQIAAELGCCQANVSKICKTHGITWETGAAARDQTGDKNPNFQNGLSRSTVERITRRVVVMSGRSTHICERCDDMSHPEEQHRHHKDRDRSNNTPENIEVLCPTCHRLEHEKDMVRNEKGQYT